MWTPKHTLTLLILLISYTAPLAMPFYESPKWLNLLYYEKTNTGYQSIVDDPTFFMTKTGPKNPKQEYEASKTAILNNNTNFKTRFPLRYKILTKHLNQPYEPSIIPSKNVQSIRIVYPNQYMKNPASIFGHLFLVIEEEDGLIESEIFHYVADTQLSSGISYIVNGISGKYTGMFFKEPYFKKIKNYNHMEDRNINYYTLNLSPEEIETFQLHSLEIQNKAFQYFFIDENCAFFIGKFLNIILDTPILERKAYTTPSDIINSLYQESRLHNEEKRIAHTKTFTHHYTQLTPKEKKQVQTLFKKESQTRTLPPNVLKTFLYLSEYRISNYTDTTDIIRKNRIHAYQTLEKSNDTNIRNIQETSQNPSAINDRSSHFQWKNSNELTLSYAPIHYAKNHYFNDNTIVDIKTLNTGIHFKKDRPLQIHFDFFEIRNITPYTPLTETHSWILKSQVIAHDSSLLTNNHFLFGRAHYLNPTLLAYYLGGASFNNYNTVLKEKKDLQFQLESKIGLSKLLKKDTLKWILEHQQKQNTSQIKSGFTLKHNNTVYKLYLEKTDGIKDPKLTVAIEKLFY